MDGMLVAMNGLAMREFSRRDRTRSLSFANEVEMGMNAIKHRCSWVNLKNPLYVKYHDQEWGRRPRNDQALYELFILETFQAGLSWECVLNKREAIKSAFDGFDTARIVAYGEEDVERQMATEGIIRNRAKLRAVVTNTCVCLRLREEFGSFGKYVESFAGTSRTVEPYTVRTTSPVSDALSADMRRRGMKFVGSTTVYAFLQAAGYINAHGPECDLGKERCVRSSPMASGG